MATYSSVRHVVLTGPPGVGKTTLVHHVSEQLQSMGIPVQGFYTEELREKGRRIGFDVVTFSGQRGTLSRISSHDSGGVPSSRREYRVGQYAVELQAFEQTALPTLKPQAQSRSPIYIIDEIGKMELFSKPFIQSVQQILDKPSTTMLATIPIPKGRPIPFVEQVRSHKAATVFTVSRENRDNIGDEILNAVLQSYKAQHPT